MILCQGVGGLSEVSLRNTFGNKGKSLNKE